MSRFVSSGTISSSGEVKDKSPTEAANTKSNTEWARVQKELDAERAKRSEARRRAVEGEEKSLYDVLQANKAAKEAAFEEQNKLRNQFKALDEDDVEYLDEVRAKKKREEDKLRQETEEGLKTFRERQKGQEEDDEVKTAEDGSWAFERRKKRKREKTDKEFGLKKGVRRRTVEEKCTEVEGKGDGRMEEKSEPREAEEVKTSSAKPTLGLVDYGSDDSD